MERDLSKVSKVIVLHNERRQFVISGSKANGNQNAHGTGVRQNTSHKLGNLLPKKTPAENKQRRITGNVISGTRSNTRTQYLSSPNVVMTQVLFGKKIGIFNKLPYHVF